MTGVLVGIVFGAIWGIAGASGLAARARAAALTLVVLITGSVVAVALTRHARGWSMPHSFDVPVYLLAVAFEMVAIPLGAIVLRRVGLRAAIPAFAAIVVALHFAGLWQATGSTGFLVLGAALLVPPAAALLSSRPADGESAGRILAITGLGSFAVLAAASLAAL